jgi:hypothetical protein
VTDSGVPELEIAQARSNAQGSLTTPVDISAAYVTYVKPLIGSEAAGFFVQAGAPGPAIYVAVDPATLTPAPAVGDRVAFRATAYALVSGLSEITAVTNWQRLSASNPIGSFTQDLTASNMVSANLDSLEAELVSIRGVLDAGFTSASSPYVAAFIATAASPADAVRFRAPQAVVDALELERGCEITAGPVPMWRFNLQAQPNAFMSADVLIHGCPGPTVVSASQLSSTSVAVNFSRSIQASSVNTSGTQFTFNNGLMASAASVAGKVVTVTTSAQDGGTTYTVTVGSGITDTRGSALGTPNTANFTAARPNVCTAANQVVISQVYGGGGNSGSVYTNDFIELHNRGSTIANLGNYSLWFVSANGTGAWTRFQLPSVTLLNPGQFYLVQAAAGTNMTGALPTPDAVSTLAIGATGFKIALTDSTVASISGACPPTTGLVDFLSAASTNCFEGSAASAAPANATAVIRKATTGTELACVDSNDSATDLVVATPTPRNTSTTSACTMACPGL